MHLPYLNHPWTIGKGHDISFFPEKGWIWSLDHFKFTKQLHCINLLCHFMANLVVEKKQQTLICLTKKKKTKQIMWTNISHFSYLQTVCWDAMSSHLHTFNFLHIKNLRFSKPEKKNLTAAPKNSRVGTRMPSEDMPQLSQLLQLLLQPQRRSRAATGRTCHRAADASVGRCFTEGEPMYDCMFFVIMAMTIKMRAVFSWLLTQIETNTKNLQNQKHTTFLLGAGLLCIFWVNILTSSHSTLENQHNNYVYNRKCFSMLHSEVSPRKKK